MHPFITRRLRRAPIIRPLWDEFERMQASSASAFAERDAALAALNVAVTERDAALAGLDAPPDDAGHLRSLNKAETEDFIIQIDHSWSNDSSIGLVGWCISKIGNIDHLYLTVGGHTIEVTEFSPRPDIYAQYSQYLSTDLCGFSARIERVAKHLVTAHVISGEQAAQVCFPVDGRPPSKGRYEWFDIFDQFVDEVKNRHLKVLEIGSRIVLPGTTGRRHLFGDDIEYIGFDYYKDENTDVTGDAHRLSTYFPEDKFGAIFSFSVLEHTAMPWVVALEMIKLLDVGGLIFAHVPAAWPPHEEPSDFWRISPDGLKILFSPSFGMNVEAVLYDQPLHMYLDDPVPLQQMFPLAPAYGFAGITARKVREIDYSRHKWLGSHEDAIGYDNFYPVPRDLA